MPDVNADSPAQKSALVANPHKVGWFWRLLGLYQQQSHPLSAELYGGDEAEKSLVADWWEKQLRLGADRKERYRIYEEMDSFDMVSAVLDLYSEESTQKDYDRGTSVWIESKSRAMIDAGNDCLRNCQVEDRVTPMIRRMCKFGDAFQRLIYQTGKGVLSWRYASTVAIARVEDKYNRLIGFREDGKQYRQKQRKISWPWDYVHFRLLGKDEESGHGTSILEAMFRPWRQMCLVSGTRIWTTRGPVSVEKLEVGDTTYCYDFETRETRETDVVKLISMGEQDLLRIRTRHRSIIVTENHGLLVKDAQGNFLYKRAKDLVVRPESNPKKTDQLVLPSVLYGEDTQTVTINPADYFVRLVKPADTVSAGIMARIRTCNLATSDKNAHTFLRGARKIRHSDYIKLSKEFRLPEATVHVLHSNKPSPFGVDMRFTYGVDFLRLFGFMLGDGWVRGKLVGFALGIDEAQNQNYINLFCSIFGIDKYSREEAVFGEKGATVAFHSKATADLFRAVGFCTGFANKIVPDQMFGLSVAGKRALIEGMFDADGGYYESPTDSNAGWRLTLANKQLIDDIVMLSQQVGFDVSHEPAVIEREGKQTAYRIWINARMPAVPEPVMYENVLEVTRVGCGETWDLTVDDDLHNFVAEGVVSHNTLTEDSILMYRLRRAPDRNMIMVDVGDMEEHEAMDMVNVWRKRFRKHEFVDPACVDLGQRVKTLSGDMTVQQVIAAYERGEEIWVYGYDELQKKIKPGRVSWAGVTRKEAKRIEVVLDDGTKVVVTPDHPFAVMNGKPNRRGPASQDAATKISWVAAEDLLVGSQLVPLRFGSHLKGGKRRYATLLDPFGGWGFIHHRVCDAVGIELGASIQCHHRDGDTLNNNPRNLEGLPVAEHTRHHSSTRFVGHSWEVVCAVCGIRFRTTRNKKVNGRGKFCSRACAVAGKKKADPSKHPDMQAFYAARRVTAKVQLECTYCGEPYTVLRNVYVRRGSKFCSTRCACRHRAKVRQGLVPVPNHQVVSVRVLELCADTGDLTVEKLANFFVSSASGGGVLVHNSPNYKKQYNPLTPLEDIFIPIRGQDTATRIETLSGAGNVEDVYDLQHYVNKFSAASKVPKAYLGFESEINAKATLMQQDVRFARTIKRVQKAAMYGLRQLLDIHYTLLPTTPDENKYDFTLAENAYVVQMSPISYLDEWERLELIQLRYQIVDAMSRLAADMQLDARAWSAYVLLNYAKLPEDLVMKLIAKSPDKVGMEGLENLTNLFGIEPDKYKQIMDDPKQRAQIMESMGTAGFYTIKPAEEIAIAKLMHESAPLRKVVGDIAEYEMDFIQQAKLQTDPSLLPPIVGGVVLEDAYEDDAEAKILREDMQALELGEEPLTEDKA